MVIAIGVIASLSCREEKQVDIHLPPGFIGVVELRLDESKGEDLVFRNGKAVLHVPSDGIVYLRSLDALHDRHAERIIDSEGNELEFINDETEGVVRAWDLGYSVSQNRPPRMGIFVGTPEEWHKVDRVAIGF